MKPELSTGEIYAGAITTPEGVVSHIILLSGHLEPVIWNEAMTWAESIGGVLPDIVEQALLYKYLQEQFYPMGYWSSEQHALDLDFAWLQYFGYGGQLNDKKSTKYRAVAVRRVTA